jgi:hypothetical protein
LKQAPGGVLYHQAPLGVGGGGLRPAAKSWDPSLLSRIILVIKYLKCHFLKISFGGLKAILCLFTCFSNIRGGLGNKVGVENNYSILGRWV